jgi:hypothetical protein
VRLLVEWDLVNIVIKDYDLGINYHPRRANVIADALSQKSHQNKMIIEKMPFNLCEEFHKFNLRLVVNTRVVAMEVDSMLPHDIHKGELENEKL